MCYILYKTVYFVKLVNSHFKSTNKLYYLADVFYGLNKMCIQQICEKTFINICLKYYF